MITGFLTILILALFTWIALKTKNPFVFMILFAMAVPLGLSTPDMISSEASTTGVDLAFGLGIGLYGMLCAGWTFKLLLTPEVVNEQKEVV